MESLGVDDPAAGLALLAADNQAGLGCGDLMFADTDLPMAQVLTSNDRILNMTWVMSHNMRNPETFLFSWL